MNSIFTIERRKNLKESFDIFIIDLQSTVVTTSTNDRYKMVNYFDRCIRQLAA